MPGLVRGMARTAAVVGTATATRNAVNRRQADKNAQAYARRRGPQRPHRRSRSSMRRRRPSRSSTLPRRRSSTRRGPAPAQEEDVITQLERLGALKAQGILTEEEFAAQKAKLLGS